MSDKKESGTFWAREELIKKFKLVKMIYVKPLNEDQEKVIGFLRDTAIIEVVIEEKDKREIVGRWFGGVLNSPEVEL